MISKQKIALVHVGKKELGLSEPEYREALRHHAGVKSAKDLDEEGFKKVIDHMKALGFWIKRNFEQSRPRDAGDLPTPDQLRVIEHLWEDLAQYLNAAHNINFRRGFYEKRVRIAPLGPQTRAEANHVIEVLKQRVRQEGKKAVERSRA
ncbi:MAG: PF06252 family protein [Candidatus Peregrinibacteria bacterium GW2011_GWA2_54_9]|nr:MAG: PF06252 family protein [Candidatus Peregrinibacteria bacterium GW2011_GWA2_54_9]